MKVLIAAICLVALVALALGEGGKGCSEERVTKMCGPEGEAKKKKMMESMTPECQTKMKPFGEKCKKICEDYNSDKDFKKACEGKKALFKEIKGAAPECMPKKKE